jgi:hypothetical protein
MPLDRFLLDIADRESGGANDVQSAVGVGFRLERKLVELLAFKGYEARLEARSGGVEIRLDCPVLLGLERLDFELALADEPQGDRLHAAGGARARQLPPQDRRKGEADEIVEGAARKIRIYQLVIDRPWVGHSVEDGRARDGIEDDAVDLGSGQGPALLEDLEQMPGDRLALAVGVRRQDQAVGAFHGIGDFLDALLRLRVDFPGHGEVGVRLHRAVFRRKVPYVAVTGQNLVVAAQVFVDRLRLGGGFDDDNVGGFGHGLGT